MIPLGYDAFPVLGLIVALVVGLAFLICGGNWLAGGAAGLALNWKISPVVVGLTVVAFATSTPELFASVLSSMRDLPGLAVGNVVGSNAANIGLILGVAALISPMVVEERLIRREVPMLLGATAVFWGMAYSGGGLLGRLEGILLLVLLVTYVIFVIKTAKSANFVKAVEAELSEVYLTAGKCIVLAVGGTLSLVLGADVLVEASVEVATRLGVSDFVIGVTVVSIGTSLPELAATVAAALRRDMGIAVGNIIGSNLFNILMIIGVTALLKPLPVATNLFLVEFPLLMVVTLILALFVMTGRFVSRAEGILLLVAYVLFLGVSTWSQVHG